MTKRAPVTLGDRVRAKRLELNLSQLDLATLAGIRPETVSRLENSKTAGALGTLHKVAPHLGTTIDALLADEAAQQTAGPNKAKATKETKGRKSK